MVVGPQAELGKNSRPNKSWIYTRAFTRKKHKLITTSLLHRTVWTCLHKHLVCCFPRRTHDRPCLKQVITLCLNRACLKLNETDYLDCIFSVAYQQRAAVLSACDAV